MTKHLSKASHNFSVALENYLKAIWELERTPNQRSRATDLAKVMGVTLPSVCNMLTKLKREDLIISTKAPLELSASGHKRLANLLRRHQLIEMFLSKTLGLGTTETHYEAELLEHAVSDRLMKHIDRYLLHPSTDVQGEPIPANSGVVSKTISSQKKTKAHS